MMRMVGFVCRMLAVITILLLQRNVRCLSDESMGKTEKVELKEKVIEMFDHAYGAYKENAFPADELMPLSCRGRDRFTDVDRGDVDEALGNFSLTLIDTLDTLVVLDKLDEFEQQTRYVISSVSFNSDLVVSVFETNIRVLGGLLGAHCVAVELRDTGKKMSWYKNELLLKAVDIGDRLLVAFNTTTGIPYPKVNLKYGIKHPLSRVGSESTTCTACAGTMIMEFAALSRLTGNPVYEEKAQRAMEQLWSKRSRHSDLVGTTIDIHNGDWVRRDAGVGAGIDSYYEYTLKAYILLGDESYLQKFNMHYAAIDRYLKNGHMFLDVQMNEPEQSTRLFVDALQAFWPGLQVLKGDLKPAIQMHEALYRVAKKFNFLPEAFTPAMDVHWAQHPLRPEFAESTYFLYQATRDPHYLSVGKHIISTLEQFARVPCGYAAVQNVITHTKEDKMDSFFLAETFKYLYLLFSEDSDIPIDVNKFIFTTEAHLLPLTLSIASATNRTTNRTSSSARHRIDHAAADLPSSCPNPITRNADLQAFAKNIRGAMASVNEGESAMPKCRQKSKIRVSETAENIVVNLKADPNSKSRLYAADFNLQSSEHLQILKDMGISMVKGEDGKIQLIQQAAMAATVKDAQDGMLFMHDMMQLVKEKTDEPVELMKPRVIQLYSSNLGGVAFTAGPAQFGPDLAVDEMGLIADIVEAKPFQICDEHFENGDELRNRIVLMQRGGCMFIDKVRNAQAKGAVGVVLMDNNAGSSVETQPAFAMSGDNMTGDVLIPSVFVFHKEAELIRKHMREQLSIGSYLKVRLGIKAKFLATGEQGLGKDTESTSWKTGSSHITYLPSVKKSIEIIGTGEKVTTLTKEHVEKAEDGTYVRATHTSVTRCPTVTSDESLCEETDYTHEKNLVDAEVEKLNLQPVDRMSKKNRDIIDIAKKYEHEEEKRRIAGIISGGEILVMKESEDGSAQMVPIEEVLEEPKPDRVIQTTDDGVIMINDNPDCLQRGIQFIGNSYDTFDQKGYQVTWRRCDEICKEDFLCKYWTMKKGTEDDTIVCSLLTTMIESSRNPVFYSAEKGCSDNSKPYFVKEPARGEIFGRAARRRRKAEKLAEENLFTNISVNIDLPKGAKIVQPEAKDGSSVDLLSDTLVEGGTDLLSGERYDVKDDPDIWLSGTLENPLPESMAAHKRTTSTSRDGDVHTDVNKEADAGADLPSATSSDEKKSGKQEDIDASSKDPFSDKYNLHVLSSDKLHDLLTGTYKSHDLLSGTDASVEDSDSRSTTDGDDLLSGTDKTHELLSGTDSSVKVSDSRTTTEADDMLSGTDKSNDLLLGTDASVEDSDSRTTTEGEGVNLDDIDKMFEGLEPDEIDKMLDSGELDPDDVFPGVD